MNGISKYFNSSRGEHFECQKIATSTSNPDLSKTQEMFYVVAVPDTYRDDISDGYSIWDRISSHQLHILG